MMYQVAFVVIRNSGSAHDVTRHALLSAWLRLGSIRGDAVLSTWLHQITRRHALISATRQASQWFAVVDVDVAAAPGDLLVP